MAAERPAGGEEKELRHNNNNNRPRARSGEAHTQNCVTAIYNQLESIDVKVHRKLVILHKETEEGAMQTIRIIRI